MKEEAVYNTEPFWLDLWSDDLISSRTQSSPALCGILLHPAGHTRSPAMHMAAFASLDIRAIYLPFDVPPEELANAVRGARALGIRQLAISLPHKETIMEHLDEVDEIARQIGAVNTVTRVEDRLVGSNSDWIGLTRALERETTLTGKRAVILGAGGTARAALFALKQAGAHCTVLNRSVEKAERLATEFAAEDAGTLDSLIDRAHDLLLNTTRVGLQSDESPVAAEALRADSIVFDAIYDPAMTRLLQDAAAIGARTIGGKWMLVYQAVEQVRRWTGRTPDPEVLAKAFDAAG